MSVYPATLTTIYPVAENVEKLTGEDINTVNDGLFNGFNLESLDGKAATTVTVKIPVSGEKVAIRQTNKALAGASTDGRVSDGELVVGRTSSTVNTPSALTVVFTTGSVPFSSLLVSTKRTSSSS